MAHDPGFYQSTEWKQTRRAFLATRPACATPRCAGRATHADHIVPRSRGGAALDRANLQGLCHSCHSRKTAARDGGFGNAASIRVPGCDDQGSPVDPKHRWNQ